MLSDRWIAQTILSKETVSLIYLLVVCAPFLIAEYHYAGIYNLMTSGYLMWTKEVDVMRYLIEPVYEVPPFVKGLLDATAMQTGDDVVKCLESIQGEAWPLKAGPIFRKNGDALCIDFAAATKRLDASLQFPDEQGPVANARAKHFENEVQSTLDCSTWRPTPEAKSLWKKTLRYNNRKITDIDAVGTFDNSLLLVSCKSAVYSDLYDLGDFRIVRNIATRATEAASKWDQILNDLKDHPVGDNYDLQTYERIIGVVCYPQVIYCDKELLNQNATEGLPKVVSLTELAAWAGAPLKFWGDDDS